MYVYKDLRVHITSIQNHSNTKKIRACIFVDKNMM